MRICEVRRFIRGFVVYVNTPQDITILKKDSRFNIHAIYSEKQGKLIGDEFSFRCSATTLNGAKKFVESVLHKGEDNGPIINKEVDPGSNPSN